MLSEKTDRPPEERARRPRVAPPAIVRAARRVAGRLARLFGSLSEPDPDWFNSGDDICYTAGNVGIGTTSPQYRLDAQEDTAGLARFSLSNPNTGAYYQTDLRVGRGTDTNDIYIGTSGVSA